MAAVVLEEPTRMNLLGLILAQVLERQLAVRSRARWVRGLRGDVLVRSGGMAVTMVFDGSGGVRLRREAPVRATATLEAPLDVLADLTLGRHLLTHAARRSFCLRGNPLTLLRVWLLLRVSAGSAALAAVRP